MNSDIVDGVALRCLALAVALVVATSARAVKKPFLSMPLAAGTITGSSIEHVEGPRLHGALEGAGAMEKKGPAQALQIGQARRIPQTETTALTAALLHWRDLPNGRKIAAIRFRSLGALGIRLGITALEIPAGTVFLFSSRTRGDTIAVSGEEIQSLVESNLKAGESVEAARTYWSPDLGGSEVIMQVELAPSTNPTALQIYVATLSHITLDSVPAPRPRPQGTKPRQ